MLLNLLLIKTTISLQSLNSKKYLCINNYSNNVELINTKNNNAFTCQFEIKKIDNLSIFKSKKGYLKIDKITKKPIVTKTIDKNTQWKVMRNKKVAILKTSLDNKNEYVYCLSNNTDNNLSVEICKNSKGKMWIIKDKRNVSYKKNKKTKQLPKSHYKKGKSTHKRGKLHSKKSKLINKNNPKTKELENLNKTDINHLNKGKLLSLTNNNTLEEIKSKLASTLDPEERQDAEKLEIISKFTHKLNELGILKCYEPETIKKTTEMGGGSFEISENESKTTDINSNGLNPFDKNYDPLKATAINLLAGLRGYLNGSNCLQEKQSLYTSLESLANKTDDKKVQNGLFNLMKTVKKSEGVKNFEFEEDEKSLEGHTKDDGSDHENDFVPENKDLLGHTKDDGSDHHEDDVPENEEVEGHSKDDGSDHDQENNSEEDDNENKNEEKNSNDNPDLAGHTKDDGSNHENDFVPENEDLLGHTKDDGSDHHEDDVPENKDVEGHAEDDGSDHKTMHGDSDSHENKKHKDSDSDDKKNKKHDDSDSDDKKKKKKKKGDSSSSDNGFGKLFNPKKAKKGLKKLFKKPIKSIGKALFG